MTKNYVDFIYNKCHVEKLIAPKNTILYAEMPNGYVFSVSGLDEEICVALAKIKIGELESYLEIDKEHYGYEFDNEYE